MAGKLEFPESLPPPPSPPCTLLLGPTDFSFPVEKCPSFDSTSNSSCDTTSMTSCSISYTTSRHANDQWFYSSSSTSSSVSGAYPDSLSFEDYGPVMAKKEPVSLYPLMDIMDGKEVVTITTSNTTHTSNTLSVSVPASESHYSLPYKGMQLVSSRERDKNASMKCVPQTSEYNGALNTEPNADSTLLTPGAFLSESLHFLYNGHIPCSFSSSATPVQATDIYENPDVSTKVDAWGCSRQDYLRATPQMYQLSCKALSSKDGFKPLDVLLTPKKFTHSQDTESSNENTSCGPEVDSISNADDFEQDLKCIEQLEEEEQKETDRQAGQKSYDLGRLLPIGVFWDIENCQVPKGLSATHVVQAIRTRFFSNHREVEFMCVCDTLKENTTILEELNDAQVNVMHVGSTVKNAADDKRLQSMRRFADIHGPGATIVLISGDSNFATELYDLRYRKNLHVILVHNAHAQDSLKLSAHETALFTEVTQQLPQRALKPKSDYLQRNVFVRNLPKGIEEQAVRRRLNMLSANCGGKVRRISANCATIYFKTTELAARAKKRLDGEDVYGSRICCSFGRFSDKEGPKIDTSGKWLQESTHDREPDLPQNLETRDILRYNIPQQTMGEVATPGLSWRMKDSLGDSASMQQQQQQPYSAFTTYGNPQSVSLPSDEQPSVQRSWQSNNHRLSGNPKVGGTSGSFSGLSRDYSLHNRDSIEESSGGNQPLYVDRMQDTYYKSRYQKPTFRMSSPPAFSFYPRNSDSYLFSNMSRGRSPSPQTGGRISPLKNTWNTSVATDMQKHLCSGIQEISVGSSGAGTNLGSTDQMPVDLQIANLDQNIDAREMKRILFTVFRDHVMVYDDDDEGEKQLQLVERERIRVLGEQVGAVVRGSPCQAIKISALTRVFTRYYGCSLKPSQYGSSSLVELIGKLRNYVKLVETEDEPIVALVDRGHVLEMMTRARTILWDAPEGSLALDKFMETYEEHYNTSPDLEIMKKDLEDIVTIEDDVKISLVPLQLFARDLLTLLHEAGGRMNLMNFDTAFVDRFGVACRPAAYGFPNIVALVQSLGDLVTVRGKGMKRILVLNQDFVPTPSFSHVTSQSVYGDVGSSVTASNDPSLYPSASQLPLPHGVSNATHYEYQQLMPDSSTNAHLVMSVNPSSHHQPYQPSSPVVYPGSPAASGGSMVWGQMWSPQYPVMPPLSPAHYMVPTIPVSWGSVSASPVGAVNSDGTPAQLQSSLAPPPVSIHTLDELVKQGSKVSDAFTSPPNACELPTPDLFTQVHPPDIPPVGIVAYSEEQKTTCIEEGSTDWNTNNVSGKAEVTLASAVPKLQTKRRIAAQFASR